MNENNERCSNFELLRILAMMAIVAGHLFNAAAPYTDATSTIAANLMSTGIRIAVNVFVMIGAWFMVDYDFKADRVLRLYFAALSYSLVSLGVTFFTRGGVSAVEFVRGIEPFFGVQYWFVTVYIALLLLAPFLKAFFRFPRRTQFFILAAIGFFICTFATYPYPKAGSMERFFGWFCYLFLLTGFIKRGLRLSSSKVLILGGGGSILYVTLAIARHLEHGGGLSFQYTYDMVSWPNFLCALCIFLVAANTKPFHNRLINLLAKHAFGVYLLHGIFVGWFGGKQFCPSVMAGAIIGIYVICCGCDAIRTALIEPLYRNRRWYAALCRKIDSCFLST